MPMLQNVFTACTIPQKMLRGRQRGFRKVF